MIFDMSDVEIGDVVAIYADDIVRFTDISISDNDSLQSQVPIKIIIYGKVIDIYDDHISVASFFTPEQPASDGYTIPMNIITYAEILQKPQKEKI